MSGRPAKCPGVDPIGDRPGAAPDPGGPPGRARTSVHDGPQSAKAALAGILAWPVAGWWLDSPLAVIAPWVAIVTVQTTVYRSVRDGHGSSARWRSSPYWPPACIVPNTLAAMCIVLPATLALTLWRRASDQGVYSATTALFVLVYGRPPADPAGSVDAWSGRSVAT